MIIPGLPILISREDKIKRLVRTFLREETTMRACSLRNLQIIIGVQLSLVERLAWDEKAAGSNPATPTIWCYSVMANISDFLSEKFGFDPQQHHHLISASGRVGELQRTVNPPPMDEQVRILPCRPIYRHMFQGWRWRRSKIPCGRFDSSLSMPKK